MTGAGIVQRPCRGHELRRLDPDEESPRPGPYDGRERNREDSGRGRYRRDPPDERCREPAPPGEGDRRADEHAGLKDGDGEEAGRQERRDLVLGMAPGLAHGDGHRLTSLQRQVGPAQRSRPRPRRRKVGELVALDQLGQTVTDRCAASEPPEPLDGAVGGVGAEQLLVLLGPLGGEVQLDGDPLRPEDENSIRRPDANGSRLHPVLPLAPDGVAAQLALGQPLRAGLTLQELLAEVDEGQGVLELGEVEPSRREVGVGKLGAERRGQDDLRTLPPSAAPDDEAESFQRPEPPPAGRVAREKATRQLVRRTHSMTRRITQHRDIPACQSRAWHCHSRSNSLSTHGRSAKMLL